MQQQWRQDSQPASATYETVALHPQYDREGLLTDVLLTLPESGPQFSHWLGVEYDELGRTAAMTDFTGAAIRMGYDKFGEPSAVVFKRGDKEEGVKIQRDEQGRVRRIETSWGFGQENTYDRNTGELEKLELVQGADKAIIELDQGKPRKVREFDGGELTVSYYDRGSHAGALQEIRTPNQLSLKYAYDDENRLASVGIGVTTGSIIYMTLRGV